MRSSNRAVAVGLALLACYCPVLPGEEWDGQTPKTHWKEYAYPRHGFAITLPQAPKEAGYVDGTRYRLYWNDSWDADTQIVAELTTRKASTDCATWIVAFRKSLDQFASLKPIAMNHEVTINGNSAFEGEFPGARRTEYERHQCLNGIVFDFYARWPPGQPKPAIVSRIFNGFRLISSEIKK